MHVCGVVLFFFLFCFHRNESTSGCCGLIPYWNSQLCEGLKWSLGFMIAFGILFAILYTLLRFADIPVTRRTYNWASTDQRVSNPSSLGNAIVDCSKDVMFVKIYYLFFFFF